MPSTRHLPALLLVAVGVLWLLIEIGFVPAALTLALFSWWPLLLIAVGLDLVVPAARRGPLPIIVYAAAIILIIGALGSAGRQRQTVDVFQRDLPTGARSLEVSLELANPRTVVGATSDAQLVEARFSGLRPGEVTLTGEEQLFVDVKPRRVAPGLLLSSGEWRVSLTPDLPLALTVNGGAGSSQLDLSHLDLVRLQLRASSGASRLLLPGNGRYYQAELAGGSGKLDVAVAPGASLDLTAKPGSGGMNLSVGPNTDLQLTLATSSGNVTLNLPQDAPIRLTISSDGSGAVRVADFLARRSGRGDTGVWESAGLARGGRVIEVNVIKVGSGSIAVN